MSLTFRSDISIELLGQHGSDLDICRAAWVSSGNDDVDADVKRQTGLIRALVRDRHGTPFEAGYFDFRVEAPRAVRDERVRHRVGSYSSSSLRYRMDEPTLYIPPPHRPLKKAAGFKQIRPVYEPLDAETYETYIETLKYGYYATYLWMDRILDMGLEETEARRWLTHDGLYVTWKDRMNPRMIMSFLSLRTHDERAKYVSYPMWEINEMANQVEALFAQNYPITHAAFNEYGRVAP